MYTWRGSIFYFTLEVVILHGIIHILFQHCLTMYPRNVEEQVDMFKVILFWFFPQNFSMKTGGGTDSSLSLLSIFNNLNEIDGGFPSSGSSNVVIYPGIYQIIWVCIECIMCSLLWSDICNCTFLFIKMWQYVAY